jgi:signal transduction histidine kinase
MKMTAQVAPLEDERENIKEFEDVQRATLNMLEDFDTEKKRLEQVQSAALNLLEDFEAEKKRLENVQRATINILDDFNAEKNRTELNQRALLNILDDIDIERSRVAEVNQRLETVNNELGREVAARRQRESEIRELNDELEQRVLQRTAELDATNKELEGFSYSVSHDLRAPLRHIDGFSRMLEEENSIGLSDEARRCLSRIREGTRQMGRLIDELLSLARLGRKEMKVQVTGLSSIAEEAVGEMKNETEGRSIEWKLGPLPFVECDPGLMKQVFVNLLSNAVKFTRPRSQARIEVGAFAQNDRAVIFVRDNGVGFSMKYADKLFGVFQRLHRLEDFEGTGIGLATVQRILHRHGGRAWAEAELDKGATFYFTIGAEKAEGGK